MLTKRLSLPCPQRLGCAKPTTKRDGTRQIRPRYAEVDKMQITAPAATRRFTTTATAIRRVAAPVTHRRGRRPLRFPLAFNLAAVTLIALAVGIALLIRF